MLGYMYDYNNVTQQGGQFITLRIVFHQARLAHGIGITFDVQGIHQALLHKDFGFYTMLLALNQSTPSQSWPLVGGQMPKPPSL